MRVGITGSEGLIGTALRSVLERSGNGVVRFDLKRAASQDIRDRNALEAFVSQCDGVVHLAAVSRIAWGERDPKECWRTNVVGTENILWAIAQRPSRPWVVLASSREVYGNAANLPVRETAELAPLNHYAKTKVEVERLARAAVERGTNAAVLRFSNVYGSTVDHPDRVVPAFTSAAEKGDDLFLEGGNQVLDFTHVEDVSRGVLALAHMLAKREPPDGPIHLVSGQGTRLSDLAMHAIKAAGRRSRLVQREPRPYNVASFIGDPTRAQHILGWVPQTHLHTGVSDLIEAFRRERAPSTS